ncbi:Short-chain dehydrogenase [Spirosomataceae bacterium TFI 002]|nr:Short-chain dehydrogenase [Spirosomataceae bacterium TFI 002]
MGLAVITGGSKGIGRAIAEAFAAGGYEVLINARNEQELNDTKAEIEKQFGVKCHVFAADLSSKKDCNALVAYVKSLNLPLDALVNNAGKFAMGPLMGVENDDLEQLIETNLYSAFWLTRGFYDLLKASGKAHVFNICSIASLSAYPNSGAYTVSKFAMLGLSKSLRMELMPDNIKVTSIMPGATYTSSWDGVDIPESRFMKASDVAESVWSAFQLSPSAVVEEIVLRPILGDI